MFNSITGIITLKTDDRLCLDMNGLEWDIAISRSASSHLPDIGKNTKVYTWLYHREDKVLLYGFHNNEERNLFFDLLKVEGIGPGLAMKILSGMEANAFIAALDAENINLLSSIPGLGKKTAEKIIFKLRGKLTIARNEDPLVKELTAALAGMGFDSKKTQETVLTALKELNRESMSREELEREVIKYSIKKLGTSV